MKPDRKELKKALAGMAPDQIDALIQEAAEEAQAESRRQEAGRSDDPLGTIRLKEDICGHSIMWVRVAGRQWEPWLRETHGCDVEDHNLPWREYPEVGMMPPDWVAKQQGYEEDYEYDDAQS